MKNIDLLFINANVLTLDNENNQAGSVAVTDGKIVAIWDTPEPPKEIHTITVQAEVVDLKGKTLLPGFIDTHNHILLYSQFQTQINCSTPPNETISDIVDLISSKIEESADNEWILGYGYDDTLLAEHRHPTRHDLDKVSPNNPVMIKHISGHLSVVNSVALAISGIDDTITDPQGGHYGRDDGGHLNGVLYEPAAMDIIAKNIPNRTEEQMIQDLGKAAKEYIAQGITTNTDAGIGLVVGPEELDIHLKAAERGINEMKTQLMIMHNLLRKGEVYGDHTPESLNAEMLERSNGLVKLDSAKMFQDGSIQGLTGALREPYYKEPELYGDLIHDQEEFQEEVHDLHKRGFRIATHGNGDRSIGSIIDAYRYAIEKSPRDNHQHRVEHVQTGTPDDLSNMKEFGIAGSFFINHVYYWGDRHEQIFLGPERGRRISPLAEAVEKGLLFTLHSDCPITPISPLFSIWAAVNRVTRDGKVLGPEQRIDVITALKSMTIYGAKLNFDEASSGSIEVGKEADFAVLDADPTTIDPMEIKDIHVVETFIQGRSVYERDL